MASDQRQQRSGKQACRQLRASDWSLAVKRCILFDGVNAAEAKYIWQTARLMETSAGEILFEEDAFPSMMYLVQSGRYRASFSQQRSTPFAMLGDNPSDEATGREFGPHDCFGCCELLATMGGRSCTVTVVEPGWLWGIPQRVVASKLKIPPSRADSAALGALLGRCALFEDFRREHLQQVSRCAKTLVVPAGELIFAEGAVIDCLYIISDGMVRLAPEEGGEEGVTVARGEVFGESALYAEERTAVVDARATEGGATLIMLRVSSLEATVGFACQRAAGARALHERHCREVSSQQARHAAAAAAAAATAAGGAAGGSGEPIEDKRAVSGGAGRLTEAKKRFLRAARRAAKAEVEAYVAAEATVIGVTRDEVVRQYRVPCPRRPTPLAVPCPTMPQT